MTSDENAKPKFLHGLQAMRGVFAVLVVCHHVGVHSARYWGHEWLGGIFNHSTFRVDFFFVLSGFVLWAAHRADAGRAGAAPHFLMRRVWRLYPLLVTLTLVKILLFWLVPGRSLASYQIIPSLLALPQTSFPVIVAAWTLSFEVYFMALLAVCLMFPRRAALLALPAWGIGLVVVGIVLGVRPGISGLGFLTHPFVLEFVLGALAAECVGQGSNRRWGMLLCGCSFVGLCCGAVQHAWIMSHPVVVQKLYWALVFALGLGGLVLWERSCETTRWRLKDGLCLGRASYSIFLSHGFVLMAAFGLLRPQMIGRNPIWMNVSLLLVVILSVLFGLAVWKWWERPLARWCRPLERSPSPGRAAPQQAA